MRTSLRFLLVAALVAAAIPASAQTPVFGAVATPGCGGLMFNDIENAEMIAVKVPTSGACTDMQFDLRQTGGLRTGLATTGDSTDVQWLCPPNWTNPQVGSDAHFALLIYPPAAGTLANRMMIDSGTIGSQDFSVAAIQTVGNSIPSSYTGSQGIDLNLSSAGAYSVKLRGPTGAISAGFPRGTNTGIEVAFAPLAEVNTLDFTGVGCTIAGATRNPGAPADPQIDGVLLGYNVYRLVGAAGSPPTALAYYNASLNADPTDGFQYFIPLTQSYNLGLADTNPAGTPSPAPSDSNPNDLGGLQNPDGTMYSGDEVVIFQDSATNRGVARTAGSAPVVGTGYWYAFQPVMCGDITYFANAVGFGPGGGSLFNGDHGSSVSALGAGDDAVDLDLDGNIEFFSPQADVGAGPGLGLTYDGLPVLSEPVFGQMDPLAAGGDVTLSGRIDGTNVNITFQSGLEAGDVQGFNVYRGVPGTGVRVNEQLILAQGTESSVYELVDDAVQARRLSKGGTVQYSVEIVYVDGHTSSVGPFNVAVGTQTPGRRSR